MLVKIFYEIDEFCKFLSQDFLQVISNSTEKKHRKSRLTSSEIASILIYFHYSGAKNFKVYYTQSHSDLLKSYFPDLLSYTRFLERKNEAQLILALFIRHQSKNKSTGVSYIDSTALEVCHNRRASSHKLFKECAAKGKTSVGWFYGLKLHLLINHKGELIDFQITPGNVTDNNKDLIGRLTDKLSGGVLVGDRGYIGREEDLIKKGVRLVRKPKSKMKKVPTNPIDAALLKSRAIIESVIGVLKEGFSLEHSRHRSIPAGFTYILATLSAYIFKPKKPSLADLGIFLSNIS